MPPSRPLERHAFRAFGLSWQNTDVIRSLMEKLLKLGYTESAGRLAQRLLELLPGDIEAIRVIAKMSETTELGGQIIPPIRRVDLPGP